jgi:hypothetical protein
MNVRITEAQRTADFICVHALKTVRVECERFPVYLMDWIGGPAEVEHCIS